MELDYETRIHITNRGKRKDRRDKQKKHLKEWMRLLVPVLKDSPSKERKFLRWRLSELELSVIWRVMPGGVKSGELEVLLDTPVAA